MWDSMRARVTVSDSTFALSAGVAAMLTVAKLVGALLNPPHFRPLTPHDDALYVGRAVQMMDGHWAGLVDQ